jgi:Ca2+-binding EF-hand superfamily protein
MAMSILRYWWIVAVVAAGLIIGIGTAAGQNPSGGGADRQARMLEKHPEADANQDGQISREEWQKYQQSKGGGSKGPRRFEGKGFGGPVTRPAGGPGWGRPDPQMLLERHPELDTNGDGKLSDEEMKAGREKLRQEMMQRHGPPAPVMDALIRNFDKFDADSNGQLSKEELIQAREKMLSGPLGPGFGGPPGAGFGGPGGPREGAPAKMLLERHPEADTDKDGKLSDEEIKAFRETTREQHRANRPGRGQGGANQ